MCSPLKRMLCNWGLLALRGSQQNRDFRSGAESWASSLFDVFAEGESVWLVSAVVCSPIEPPFGSGVVQHRSDRFGLHLVLRMIRTKTGMPRGESAVLSHRTAVGQFCGVILKEATMRRREGSCTSLGKRLCCRQHAKEFFFFW